VATVVNDSQGGIGQFTGVEFTAIQGHNGILPPLGIKLTGFEYGNRSFMYHRDIPSM
jgi:hypothetical protein